MPTKLVIILFVCLYSCSSNGQNLEFGIGINKAFRYSLNMENEPHSFVTTNYGMGVNCSATLNNIKSGALNFSFMLRFFSTNANVELEGGALAGSYWDRFRTKKHNIAISALPILYQSNRKTFFQMGFQYAYLFFSKNVGKHYYSFAGNTIENDYAIKNPTINFRHNVSLLLVLKRQFEFDKKYYLLPKIMFDMGLIREYNTYMPFQTGKLCFELCISKK